MEFQGAIKKIKVEFLGVLVGSCLAMIEILVFYFRLILKLTLASLSNQAVFLHGQAVKAKR